jgi:hypothetical protein
MGNTGEVVLYQLFCGLCGSMFHICRHCYRGQKYCCESCRTIARRRQMDAARLRYRRTPEAKLDQRDRQKQWRMRQSQKNTVMDQGSMAEQDVPSSNGRECTSRRPFRFESVIAALNNGLSRVLGAPYCVICGCAGKFINPFHVGRSCYS